MPRRYRPPTRRRKTKKEQAFEPAPPSYSNVAQTPATEVSTPAPRPRAERQEGEGERPVRHIPGDFSYVLDEIRLTAIITAIIVIGLVITAILR